SFSSSKIPLLYEGNQESIEVNSGSEIERLSQEHDSARGRSSVIESAQNLAEEWKQEFAAGLDLITDSRPAYAKKINEGLAFKILPEYLNAFVGDQLESLKELSSKSIQGVAMDKDASLGYWLKKSPKELDSMLNSYGPNQLHHFLGNKHDPEELEHLDLQVGRMMLDRKILLFHYINQLNTDDFDQMVINSKEISAKLNDDVSRLYPKSKYVMEQSDFLKEEKEFRKKVIQALQDKLGPEGARKLYLLMAKASQVHIKGKIQDFMREQETLDEMFSDTLKMQDRSAPPIEVIKIALAAIQTLYKKINNISDQRSQMIPENPLRLSTLWNVKSHEDLRTFASQVQLFQNIIHRHLLRLFVNTGRWHHSQAYSYDRWLEKADHISNCPVIEQSPPEFRRSFIEQLEEAEKSFGKWWAR
ncbi:hypothetical protein PCASD_19395, partial [Puccinia coronata f. sp. avenae]